MDKLTEEEIEKIREAILEAPAEEREEKAQEILSQLTPDQVKQLQGGTPQCPFCLMGEGKIPTTTLFEDENFKSVLEINPAHEGHVIVYPKKHFATLTNLNSVQIEMLFLLVTGISTALEKIYGATSVYIPNGKVAGQRFDHLVVNIIPRTANDGIQFGWTPKASKPQELEEIKNKILEFMPKEEKQEVIAEIPDNIFTSAPSYEKRRP